MCGSSKYKILSNHFSNRKLLPSTLSSKNFSQNTTVPRTHAACLEIPNALSRSLNDRNSFRTLGSNAENV